MKISHFLIVVLSIFCVNVFASEAHNNSDMCLSAYLEKRIHVGDIAFYNKDKLLDVISVHGSWVDVVTIRSIDGGYFKDQQEFEDNKLFLRIENFGRKLGVKKFTYQVC